MGLALPFAIDFTNPTASADKRYGPHADIAAALAATAGTREKGLTVGIINPDTGKAVDYWFEADITDESLVKKTPEANTGNGAPYLFCWDLSELRYMTKLVNNNYFILQENGGIYYYDESYEGEESLPNTMIPDERIIDGVTLPGRFRFYGTLSIPKNGRTMHIPSDVNTGTLNALYDYTVYFQPGCNLMEFTVIESAYFSTMKVSIDNASNANPVTISFVPPSPYQIFWKGAQNQTSVVIPANTYAEFNISFEYTPSISRIMKVDFFYINKDRYANIVSSGAEDDVLVRSASGQPVSAGFKGGQVVQVSGISMSDINVGEKKIMVAEKGSDGNPFFGGAIGLLDVIGNPGLTTLLAETSNAWIADEITITGDNRQGQLGENSQLYELESDFFLCKAHYNGTTALDGWATWKRNRGTDSLSLSVAAHVTIIEQLETEAGWNANAQFKQINAKSKRGTWFRRITGGYLFMCIDDSNGWTRVGTPPTVSMEITSVSHPVLTASLIANDWVANPFYMEKTNTNDELAEQGQEWWDSTNKKAYKRNMDGYWIKLN